MEKTDVDSIFNDRSFDNSNQFPPKFHGMIYSLQNRMKEEIKEKVDSSEGEEAVKFLETLDDYHNGVTEQFNNILDGIFPPDNRNVYVAIRQIQDAVAHCVSTLGTDVRYRKKVCA